ncbi:hypothetical protein PSEUBRA_000547 [Kalmanozyma brasiliensis GHG001]|uniref:COP9 signalosome complex subunit 3 N-terminal helical repeats domain-containing protein n=1 Tax=Kalmanozyma brasiliensis (strain GHG001) TaxID=1365824 RepID=V5EWY0_KALBG|nr:uncharacterized protein PSEUBRA_000547 [Kalmanozyma brasiliensis GHG001]EST10135.1 hypothetical protein PSEUBRA_000547 [Kalmanozyma brasiliensis GHG001]
MAITNLTGIEDTLALILECAGDLARIESTLLPALRKLCDHAPSNGESSSRSGPSSSRSQAPAVSDAVLCQPVQGNVDPLSVLDPAVHSIGMLYILVARATHSAGSVENGTLLLPHITAFVQRFSPPQVHLAGDKVAQLAATFSALGDQVTNPESALQLLQALASRFLTRSESITALHPMLAYQYLKTARYAEAATMLIDLPLIDADTSITPLVHSDILQYFYYAALIYIKLDRLHDAIDALETCISSPAVAVSAIHMDAYKKLVLVQLLADGKVSPVPQYTPQVITRAWKQMGSPGQTPYNTFASAYARGDDKGLDAARRIAEERKDVFEKDRNMGLVRRCLALLTQRRVQKLGEVYSALSLNQIAQKIGAQGDDVVQGVYADVQDIVRKGWIYATLSPPRGASGAVNGDWVVHFDSFGGDSFTSTSSISLLEDKIRTAKQWQALLQERDRQIQKSPAYLTRGLKIRDARTAGADAYAEGDEFHAFDDADY